MTDGRWTGSSTPYFHPHQRDAWQEEAARRGSSGEQRILQADVIAAPEEISVALRLPTGARVVCRRRLMLLDGRPVELASSYWPADVAEGTALAEPQKIRGGAVSLLATLGFTPASVDERVSARPPTAEERRALAMHDEHEWVLALTRVITNEGGRPYEATAMVMPGSIGQLNYSMKVDHDDN